VLAPGCYDALGARLIVEAVDRPVIADTGYGNPINVIRTVRA
jgi:2-methylisocitrate lyase-like PEP mutase family enzyme